VKFLCDRCKTRYSIGDDRVRGKILKIRCKSCGNVITVREGMSVEGDAAPADAAGRSKSPTASPEARRADRTSGEVPAGSRTSGELPAVGRASGELPAASRGPASPAAASREPVKPSGAAAGAAGRAGRGPTMTRDPLAAALAKRSAEVDTARGLGRAGARDQAGTPRGEPASANPLDVAFASTLTAPALAAPALTAPAPAALEEEWYVSADGEQAGPYALADAQQWIAQQPAGAELHCWSEGFDDWLPVDKVSHFRGLRKRAPAAAPPPLPRAAGSPKALTEETPKPLFAATMAAIERGAPVLPSSGLGLPPPVAPEARATPPQGASPAPGTPAPRGTQAGWTPNGAPASRVTPLPTGGSPLASRGEAALEGGADAKPATGSKPGATPAAGQDTSWGEEEATVAARTSARSEALADIRGGRLEPVRAPGQGAKPGPRGLDNPFEASEGGDLQTQLEAMPFDDAPVEPVRMAPVEPVRMAPAPASTDFGSDDDLDIGEVSRVVSLDDIARGAPPATQRLASVPGTVSPTERRAHRRGLIVLLVVAAVVVIGAIATVAVLMTRHDDAPASSLGPVQDIDTSRPDDPVAHRPVGPAAPETPAPAVAAPAVAPRPAPRPRAALATGGNQLAEASPGGNALGGDEIEDMAHKHQEMTQRCYMRSQRGADAILIGDVKKIAVTLTIDREGNVSELQLSDHAADNLGKCLSGAIKAWKFRASAGGTFRFSLNFLAS
jgi:predicted Zn finger-like uncharacterized protein